MHTVFLFCFCVCVCVCVWVFVMDKRRKKNHFLISQIYTIVLLTIIFAALVIVRAVGALDRCQLTKTGGS